MQLPDETIAYQYQGLLAPAGEPWTPAAELRAAHFLAPARLKALAPQLMQVRGQVAAERELREAPPEQRPLEAGFIELPQQLLDAYRRKQEASDLGRVITQASRLRAEADRVVVLGAGGPARAAAALFEALRSRHHNGLAADGRMGVPRLYFAGDSLDNDALQELVEMLQTTCVDPGLREERWAVVVVSKAGDTLETAAAYRVLRREAAEYYGSTSARLRELIVPVTGGKGRLRDLFKAEGYADDAILTIPDNVGSRFSVCTAAGLLPAAIMGLDVRAFLLGAASMTRRFVEEPFERNPVLQFAGVNYLAHEELRKPLRVLAVWSEKLEALGRWYEHLVAESLGKQGRGPTPLTVVQTRGQQHQEGPRDKVVTNLVVKTSRTPAVPVGMADRNEDDLNALARKGLPDLAAAALRVTTQAHADAARPTAELVVPTLSEHTMGQLMQMLMLATVVEARLMGVNPYSQPAADAGERQLAAAVRG